MRSYSYYQKSWKNTKQSTTKMGSNRISTLCVGFVSSRRVRVCGRERSKSTTSTWGRTILRQKEHYLSASQARPMLTTGVVRSGLASVTHDKIRVKSSCFQQMMLSSWHPINNKYKIALTVWCSRIMMQMARNMELSKWQMKLCSATA